MGSSHFEAGGRSRVPRAPQAHWITKRSLPAGRALAERLRRG
jgi:hypothetical protein